MFTLYFTGWLWNFVKKDWWRLWNQNHSKNYFFNLYFYRVIVKLWQKNDKDSEIKISVRKAI